MINVDRRIRSATNHIFCFRQILEKNCKYNEEEHQLFIDLKKAYDSIRRKGLCINIIEFGITMKLVRIIKLRLTETYVSVPVDKNLSDMFPFRNDLKQGDDLSSFHINPTLEYALGVFRKIRMACN